MGKRRHFVNLLFTITLLGVFALAALSSAVMGANVYSHNAEKMQNNFDTRTSLIYITQKIRHCPGENFTIEEIDGTEALVLHETIGTDSYKSLFYVHEGILRELTLQEGTEVNLKDGQYIMELEEMWFEQNENTVTISIRNMKDEENEITLTERTSL